MSNQSEKSKQRAVDYERWLLAMPDTELKNTILTMVYILFGQRGLLVIDKEKEYE